MSPRQSGNLEILGIVAKALGGLRQRVVFVGGATIELYLAPTAPAGRPTDDVDCVVEVASRAKFYDLEEELRGLGFRHPMSAGAPICRWEYSGIPVDVMPSGGEVLGFKNRWYAGGMRDARTAELPDGSQIEIFSPPCLLASKIEAFRDRGRGDYFGSPDLEDVVTVLDGCPSLREELGKCSKEVSAFLAGSFREFLSDERFVDSLQGHIEILQPRGGRAAKVLELMREFAAA